MFKNIKFKYKIVLLPTLAGLALMLILAVNYIFGNANAQLLTNIESGNAPALEFSRDLEDILKEIQRSMQDAAIAGDQEMLGAADDLQSQFEERLKKERDKEKSGDRKENLDKINSMFLNYYSLAHKTTQMTIENASQEIEQANERENTAAPAEGMPTVNSEIEKARDRERQAKRDEIARSVQEMVRQYNEVKGNLEADTQKNKDAMAAAFKKLHVSQRDTMKIMGGITAALILIQVIFSWMIIQNVLVPLRLVFNGFARMSTGDFTQKIEITGKDEIGELGRHMNSMLDSLVKMIENIRASSVQVSSAAGGISAATEQIAKGAQIQASTVEETSSSIEEMAAQIKSVADITTNLAANVDETGVSIQQLGTSADTVAKNSETMAVNVSETSSTIEQMIVTIERTARNVKEADQLSRLANGEAESGGQAVMKTVEGMKQINQMMINISGAITGLGQHSEAINMIVSTIEEIADQTNLLALNAAIEAARAGDAGRGFSVVADEVRKLAERSMKSTREIGEVIKKVQKETDNAIKVTDEGAQSSKQGIELANLAREAISRIVEAFNTASTLMKDIAETTEEQTKAAKNVIAAVETMNNLTKSVTNSTKEQASGIGQIIKASELMTQMTDNVKNATAEQKKGGENVVVAVEKINDIAKSNLQSAEQLSTSALVLNQQSETLQELVREFRTS